MIKFLPLIFFLFLFTSCGRIKPIYVCGGGFCEEGFKEFVGWGDYIVLTADKRNVMDNMPGRCQILEVKTREEANDNFIVNSILGARALYITGGNQWTYHKEWRDTELSRAIQAVLFKIPIYVTSASSMVLGEFYFSAEFGSYPNEGNKITIERDMFKFYPFKGFIVDTHFTERDRGERLREFIGEVKKKFNFETKGLGIDEGTVLRVWGQDRKVIGKGNVHIYMSQNGV